MSWNKNNLVLIQATTGFVFQGSIAEGFRAYHPYRGTGKLLRVLREICFNVPFLPKSIWYNKEFLGSQIEYFIIWDPLITKDYLYWIKKNFPQAQINFKYANMVGRAKHLLPSDIPSFVRIWTYDKYDADKYRINLYKSHMYFPSNVKPLKQPKYDVFFIGKDKGRGDWLVELEKKMQALGVRTKFIITADGALSEKKPYYQEEINYSEVTDFLSESKAVLNVVMENQHGITVRDTEALFFGIKLITTNQYISDWDMYDPNNILIIEKDMDLSNLCEFLLKPVHKVDSKLLEKHTLSGMIDEITN